jgi:hypothetical protein
VNTAVLGRIASIVAVTTGGVVIGGVTTIYHSAWFPFGLLAAVGLIGFYIAGLRVVSRTRVLATWAALGVMGSMTLLAGLDSQGSVLIAGNTAGLAFLGSATLVTLVALAWPRLTPRASGYDGVSSSAERTSRP